MCERTESCSIPTSALKEEEAKLFQTYCVLLSVKWLVKKEEILKLKPVLSKIIKRMWLSKEKNWAILKAKVLV